MSDGPMSLEEKIERFIETVDRVPHPTTATVRRICYTGVDHEPDPMHNLAGEREAACWVLTNRKVEAPVKAALVRYIEAIDALLRSTSALPEHCKSDPRCKWVDGCACHCKKCEAAQEAEDRASRT